MANMLNPRSGSWNGEMLKRCFELVTSAMIAKLERPVVSCKDKLIWMASSNGKS